MLPRLRNLDRHFLIYQLGRYREMVIDWVDCDGIREIIESVRCYGWMFEYLRLLVLKRILKGKVGRIRRLKLSELPK
jgi:hypothetical protein